MARTIRCYYPETLRPLTEVKLPADSSHHLCRVLRLRSGDTVEIFDGQGSAFLACLKVASPKETLIEVIRQVTFPYTAPCAITLVLSMIKPDRFDWAVQKAVELGVHRIIPIETAYSSIKLHADQKIKKEEHWRNIIIHAAEQCGQNTLPLLSPITSFQTWLAEHNQNSEPCFFLDTLAQAETTHDPNSHPLTLSFLVGPEGGFTEEERQTCYSSGCIAWHLGPRILRSETAAVAGLCLLQAKYGDLGTGRKN